MVEPKYNTGNYVKWKELSKSGLEYYERGMVTDVDTGMCEVMMFGNNDDYINYDILRDDGEEIKKLQKDLETDIQGERESTLNKLL